MRLQIWGAQGQQNGRFRMQHQRHQHRRRRHAPAGTRGAFGVIFRVGAIRAQPVGVSKARAQRLGVQWKA